MGMLRSIRQIQRVRPDSQREQRAIRVPKDGKRRTRAIRFANVKQITLAWKTVA